MRHWVASDKPLGKIVGANVSAGTPEHEETSHFARDEVFDFFDDRLDLSSLLESKLSFVWCQASLLRLLYIL